MTYQDVAPEPPSPTISALPTVLAIGMFCGFATTVIWSLTSTSYYWPRWVWLGSLIAVAPLVCRSHSLSRPLGARRWLILHVDASVAIAVGVTLIWWFAGSGLSGRPGPSSPSPSRWSCIRWCSTATICCVSAVDTSWPSAWTP